MYETSPDRPNRTRRTLARAATLLGLVALVAYRRSARFPVKQPMPQRLRPPDRSMSPPSFRRTVDEPQTVGFAGALYSAVIVAGCVISARMRRRVNRAS